MLDVVRHFFGVDDVKTFIDATSALKFNHLHVHLTDDQGWRVHIDSWPRLTERASSTAVGGEPGGFYTKDDYRELVAYAANCGTRTRGGLQGLPRCGAGTHP